ncbi:nucleoside-diphosphate kinase [Candidatus Roizmanbacteria bacterium]|nr:nucleoside-diphosphate kinase [Candidatus Roizmanbacteria bacterium]
MERTLILVKPDGVARGLTGEILRRFEKTGLILIALKMVHASKDHMSKHYGNDPDWVSGMGKKTLENYEKHGIDPIKEIGSKDPLEIGKKIREWLVTWMASGPVVAAVFEGNDAVEIAKKMAGHTLPVYAAPGTIRGDFSTESAALANAEKRPIQNTVHISGNLKDAAHEINHWFPELSNK